MTVTANGTGDFKTIQEAINSIPQNNDKEVLIEIKGGIYKEKLIIDKPFVTLKGEGKDITVITYNDCAKKLLPDGTEYGTFRSYSVIIDEKAHDFKAFDITFENSAGSGENVGQAVAIRVDADKSAFYNCGFLGRQDTLYTGPLPQTPESPDILVRQYYENCYIKGDVDFIFGSATAVFNKCIIESGDRNKSTNGYITAASTYKNIKFGYVFLDCDLISTAAPNTVFLGRPWREYSSTAFINCNMGAHIKSEGWNDWRKPDKVGTVRYAEYNCKGAGADTSKRVDWCRQLTDEQAKEFTLENIFQDWKPENK